MKLGWKTIRITRKYVDTQSVSILRIARSKILKLFLRGNDEINKIVRYISILLLILSQFKKKAKFVVKILNLANILRQLVCKIEIPEESDFSAFIKSLTSFCFKYLLVGGITVALKFSSNYH